MKKNMFIALVLGLVAASYASADENYYVCYNTDASSLAPANVLAMAMPQELAGVFNAANVQPPRATFEASPTVVSDPAHLSFGPVKWDGKHDGFADFQSVSANFDASGAMSSISFTFADNSVANYAKCVVDSDN